MTANINDHLVDSGEWGAKFRCTPLIFDIFKKRKIWFSFEENSNGNQDFRFDNNVELGPYTFFTGPSSLWGMDAFSYSWTTWPLGVRIGRYCSIAGGSSVIESRHPIEWAATSTLIYRPPAARREWMSAVHDDFNEGAFDSGPTPKPIIDVDVRIGHDVWIGSNVRLAQQATIGTGSAVATGAIVTRDVEPYMVVGGVPARVIRPRFKENLIEKFLESKWWEFGPNIWKLCDYKNPEKFLDDVARVREEEAMKPYRPEKITVQHILKDLAERT